MVELEKIVDLETPAAHDDFDEDRTYHVLWPQLSENGSSSEGEYEAKIICLGVDISDLDQEAKEKGLKLPNQHDFGAASTSREKSAPKSSRGRKSKQKASLKSVDYTNADAPLVISKSPFSEETEGTGVLSESEVSESLDLESTQPPIFHRRKGRVSLEDEVAQQRMKDLYEDEEPKTKLVTGRDEVKESKEPLLDKRRNVKDSREKSLDQRKPDAKRERRQSKVTGCDDVKESKESKRHNVKDNKERNLDQKKPDTKEVRRQSKDKDRVKSEKDKGTNTLKENKEKNSEQRQGSKDRHSQKKSDQIQEANSHEKVKEKVSDCDLKQMTFERSNSKGETKHSPSKKHRKSPFKVTPLKEMKMTLGDINEDFKTLQDHKPCTDNDPKFVVKRSTSNVSENFHRSKPNKSSDNLKRSITTAFNSNPIEDKGSYAENLHRKRSKRQTTVLSNDETTSVSGSSYVGSDAAIDMFVHKIQKLEVLNKKLSRDLMALKEEMQLKDKKISDLTELNLELQCQVHKSSNITGMSSTLSYSHNEFEGNLDSFHTPRKSSEKSSPDVDHLPNRKQKSSDTVKQKLWQEGTDSEIKKAEDIAPLIYNAMANKAQLESRIGKNGSQVHIGNNVWIDSKIFNERLCKTSLEPSISLRETLSQIYTTSEMAERSLEGGTPLKGDKSQKKKKVTPAKREAVLGVFRGKSMFKSKDENFLEFATRKKGRETIRDKLKEAAKALTKQGKKDEEKKKSSRSMED